VPNGVKPAPRAELAGDLPEACMLMGGTPGGPELPGGPGPGGGPGRPGGGAPTGRPCPVAVRNGGMPVPIPDGGSGRNAGRAMGVLAGGGGGGALFGGTLGA